ncbi:unnamed protein product [Diplocarpon coronariae]|uniref:Uncharacterized protein n=1 Tax=Diplocarpon coronariae TaxID=2795749 RepID=A0A218ZAQ2_9HELO|nr:hypothetical protein B2J93_5998 [Marssonina coronariae]
MQLTTIPLLALAATAIAQGGWGQPQAPPATGASPYQPPQQGQGGYPPQNGYQPAQNNYQGGYQPQGPPSNPGQGGSWSYSTTVSKPAPNSQYPNLRDDEIDAWRSCMNGWLQGINDGAAGSGPACNVWDCLHVQASKYHRGGLLTSISNVLTPVCSAVNIGSNVPLLGGFLSRF